MNISLSLIASELSDSVTILHIHKYSVSKVSNIQILYNIDRLDNEFAYLCQGKQLLQILEAGHNVSDKNFIIYGKLSPDFDKALKESNYICISDTRSFISFINALESIFLSYNQWESQLRTLASSVSTFQEFIETAYEKIQIPMCMLNVNYDVIAINRNVDNCDSLFASMQDGYGYPYVQMIQTSNPSLPELDKEIVREVINNVSHNRLRVTSIQYKGRSLFYLGLHKQNQEEFDDRILELYEFAIEVLNQNMSSLSLKTASHKSLLEQFLLALIESNKKQNLKPGLFEQLLEYFQYKREDTYHLYLILSDTALTNRPDNQLDFMNVLENMLPDSHCFRRDSYIGILTQNTNYTTYNSLLKSILSGYPVSGIESHLFYRIEDIRRVWAQLLYIADNRKPEEIHVLLNYDHYLIPHCNSLLHQEIPAETLYHPALRCLQEYDIACHTEYLPTLICYLQNNCSVSATADKLYIHRNSLQYRIKKIEELLDDKIISSPERLDMLFSSFFIMEDGN